MRHYSANIETLQSLYSPPGMPDTHSICMHRDMQRDIKGVDSIDLAPPSK